MKPTKLQVCNSPLMQKNCYQKEKKSALVEKRILARTKNKTIIYERPQKQKKIREEESN